MNRRIAMGILMLACIGGVQAAGDSDCIQLRALGNGASVVNNCSRNMHVGVCVANANHPWKCNASNPGGLVSLRPGGSYPVVMLDMYPGQVRWAACVHPAAPQGWNGTIGDRYSCK